jgi:hypothetical protein
MIVSFNSKQVTRFENQVLFNICFVPTGPRIFCVGSFIFIQLLPATLYAIFLFLIAWSSARYQNAMIILAAITALWALMTGTTLMRFNNPYAEKKINRLKKFFDHQYPKPILQFYVEWLLRRDPFLIGGTKIFTGLLTFGICVLYTSENYDGRLMAMTATACGMANVVILHRIQDFESVHITWAKNLPITISKRFMWPLLVYAILIIPETVVLLKNAGDNLSGYGLMLIVLYALSLGAFFYGLLYQRAAKLENFVKTAFAVFILLIILILFSAPLPLLIIANFMTGFLLFRKNYYLFEKEIPRP